MSNNLSKHANKVGHGLSAAALVFLYANFAQKSDLVRHEDKEAMTQSQTWQRLMDLEVSIARMKALTYFPETNSVASNP